MGEFININKLNLDSEKNLNKLKDLYLERSYLISGSSFEKCAVIGAILGNAKKEQTKILGEYGKNLGMGVQIVNDIGDFCPPQFGLKTPEKLFSDAYNDIKTNKLTLPVIYFLEDKTLDKRVYEKFYRIIKSKIKRKQELIWLTRILLKTGAIDKAIKFTYALGKKAKKSIKSFKKRKQLNKIAVICYSNKYYSILRKLKIKNKNDK